VPCPCPFVFALVPPHIVGENTLEDVKIKEKQSVTLTCEVRGKESVLVLLELAARDDHYCLQHVCMWAMS
jgi:hypothetical protein